ncbi:zinc finger protein 493-like isoform X1 [Armigeres subalbatus]|uniref:zinc finger protein 493-like isoform X1 n=1 Tax=Armigeres subalbatus TaxID=124917 RepID=UPI002ED45BA4
MICTLCNKSSSKLITHHLCLCCSDRLECGRGESIFFVPVEHDVRKVECDVCQEPVLKDDLERHQERCSPGRTIFRCTVCDADYLDKASLWKHLESHEILDEAKEKCCQEMNVSYDLHKCVLCNDQRGYQESVYWNHVHEDHDGFFLQCPNCCDNFRSRKLMMDHDNDCKVSSISAEGSICEENCAVLAEPSKELDDNLFEESTIEFTDCGIPTEVKTENDENQFDFVNKQKKFVRKQCSSCGQEFRKHITFTTHKCYIESKVKASMATPSTESQKTEETVNKQKKFVRKQCSSCGQEFRKHITFTTHKCYIESKVKAAMATTSTETQNTEETAPSAKFQCPHCHRLLKNQGNLRVHIFTLHRPYKCNICGLQMGSYSQVKSHKNAVHTKPDQKCPHCGRMFKAKTFQNHLNSHQKASHLCADCGVMYKSYQNLQVHRKRFHTHDKPPRMSKGYIRRNRGKNEKAKVSDSTNGKSKNGKA